jgi:hypothetical protein
MNLRKRFSLALAAFALVLVAGATSAFAQGTVTFNLGTAPTFVANTGRSEVLGQVTLTADFTCGPAGADAFCNSTAGTLQVLYIGTAIDNSTATGICVQEVIGGGVPSPCNAAATYVGGGVTVNNTPAGGVVSFAVIGPGVDIDAGDQVIISGVRGRIDQSPGNVVGTPIIGQLTASPSTIASFAPTSEVVARSADPLTVAFGPLTILQCLPGAGNVGTVTLTEGFNTAFVDHDNDVAEALTPGTTINDRPLFGGTNNSRINIVLTGLPAGVTISWPIASATDSGAGLTGAQLDFVAQSASGDTATYVFSTPDQAASDVNAEVFVITIIDAVHVALTGTPSDFGTATGQAQMFPPVTPTSGRPRYNHPLENVPGDTFLTVAPCTTNLLFTWVANFAGLDTGIAIANTSADPYGTVPQTGTCTVNLWPTSQTTNNGVSGGAAVSITTAAVEPGSVWRTSLSGTPTFAGLAGYIIAVCRFQYGHGFAFITDQFGVGAANTAQGYLAQVIPDPLILGARSASLNGVDILLPGLFNPSGESLGQ